MPAADKQNTRAKQVKKRPLVRAAPRDTKGTSDLKRGAPFQRSRTYYRAYEEAQRKNPVVKKAIKDVGTEFAAKRYTSAKVKRAQANIENVRRHGSDTVAKAGYRHYTKDLWEKTKGEYGGKRPAFTVSDMPKSMVAYVYNHENEVHYGRPLTRGYMDANGSPRRAEAKSVPLHEWAHTRQKDDPRKWVIEGGAEDKARRVSRKLGTKYTNSPSYLKYENRYRAIKGRKPLADKASRLQKLARKKHLTAKERRELAAGGFQ